jgi:hypothetical protein
MVALMNNIFNQIKSECECEPDEQLSSVDNKTPGRARIDNSDTDCHSHAIPVEVQSSTHEIGETEAQEEASHAADEHYQDTQSSLPEFEYLTNDGFFDHNEPLPKDTNEEANDNDNPVAVLYKKKIFNSSFICAKRVAKLTPSDRTRLRALVKLKADDLPKAMLHVNIPPFPTAAEMAEKIAMKSTRKRSSDPVSRSKRPRRGSSLPSSSTQYNQKIAPKASRTEELIPATTMSS